MRLSKRFYLPARDHLTLLNKPAAGGGYDLDAIREPDMREIPDLTISPE
jgi:hypothetical protein